MKVCTSMALQAARLSRARKTTQYGGPVSSGERKNSVPISTFVLNTLTLSSRNMLPHSDKLYFSHLFCNVRSHLPVHYIGAYTEYKLCYLTRTGNQAFYWFPPSFEKKAAILQRNEALIFHIVLVFIVLLLAFLTAKNKIPKAWM